MKAIVDCNSFYCSCEKVFRPDLENKPVVVLSNNDGCIIARSDEAKKLGVPMAGPYFKAAPLLEQFEVTTFSSNYHLYGDMSWRVMETLRMLLPPGCVEVYSVDEAFLDLSHVPAEQLADTAVYIRKTVEMWTGIKVSVGVAPTKVLAKLANRLSKKNKVDTGCVMVLDSAAKIQEALQLTRVDDIWGIGYQYAEKLHHWGLHTAWDVRNKDVHWGKKMLGGITGIRLIRELRGVSSIGMEEELTDKKMIMTTRMFGEPVHELKDVKEAVATYISRSAEKLRRQRGAAKMIGVFVVLKEQSHQATFRRGTSISRYTKLPVATSLTHQLIKPALELAEQLFLESKGGSYKKAGVMLGSIVPDNSIQSNLFMPETANRQRFLMSAMDNVNFAMRDDVVKFAATGSERNWKMRQEKRSPRYTTRWHELFPVR